jgi:hypothetical protein
MNQPTKLTSGPSIGNEYSSVCPWSTGNKWLLLGWNDGRFGLYTGDGAFVRFLSNDVNTSSRPRWSRKDPDVLTFFDGNRIVSLNVAANQETTIHQFAEYSKIDDHGEADVSLDGDHRVLAGIRGDNGTEEVFIFALSSAEKSSLTQEPAFDGLKILGNNHPVISRSSDPRNPLADGIYDLLGIKLSSYNAHAVPARYQGKDYLITSADPTKGIGSNSIVMVDCETAKEEILFDLGSWNIAFHASACDADFCIISTYAAKDSGKPSQIWKVPFDKSGKQLICDTGTVIIPSGGGPWPYAPQPKAAVSRDGSRVVWCSNGGKTDDPNYCDAWMVRLDAAAAQPGTPAPSAGSAVRFPGFKAQPIDFTPDEGREWLWHFKVVGGKMTVDVYDKE